MQNLTIISELIKQGKKGTEDLYSKIPFFLRTRLDGIISKQLWTKVREGCQQNDQSSLDCARSMYKLVLQTADEYINACVKQPGTDNCVMMIMAKNYILNDFNTDAAKFVLEMDKCLQREKELIFTYQELDQTEQVMAEHNEDITDQSQDADITQIERLTQEVGNQLHQTKKLIEELVRFNDLSAELYETISQGHVAESPDDDSAEIRRYLAEFQNLEMNNERTIAQIVACKQSVVNGMNQLSLLSSHFVAKFTKDIATWKIAEAKRSVKVGPETNTGELLNKAKRFGAVINTVLAWFGNEGDIQVIRNSEPLPGQDHVEFFMEVGRLQLDFQNILNSHIQIIVTAQPKGVISIENKGKKESPNYCTKKTQPFSSTVRVLAGESFPSFHILSKSVELVAEKDLAQGTNTGVTGRDGLSCLKVDASNGNTLPDIQFNIEVKNFCRVEQNNVYKQFFRLLYTVKVSINGTEYPLQTMSLPFTFNTGANQILEHMGARMWYCASVQDLYTSGFQCPDPLSADQVINMLDSRVAYIGSKTRRLTAQEKTFLRGRLPVAGDETVTMQGFLKDKMKTLRNEESLSYSFYTWFYSVIHSIELLLLNAWQDGIIYGFCSEKTAEELLMNPNVPEGSFILRPSVSEIKKTSSADATAALVMEVKLRKATAHPFDDHSSEFEVSSIPLFYKHIEKNTLYGAIKGIEYNKKPVAKFLYGRDGGKKLEVLKGYVKKQEEKLYPEYRILMEKIEKINIRHSPKSTAAAEEISDGDDEGGREPNKRKRRYRKSSSNTHSQSQSQSPKMPAGANASPSGSATLPIFSSLTSGEIKQENLPHIQFQTGGAVNEQCQRSGTQGKTIAEIFEEMRKEQGYCWLNSFGTSDEETVSGNIGQQENGLLEHEVDFGDVIVDISKITHITSGHTSPHGQSHYPTADGPGITGMDVTNSLPGHVQYNNTPHQENGIYNGCFLDSASSSAYNAGYNISVKPSFDTDFHMQDLTPASVKSNFSESLPSSPGNTRMSPPSVNMQSAANLPTVLNEAKECKRQVRRQGGSRGNSASSNGKKSNISSRSTIKPVVVIPNVDPSLGSGFHFSHTNLQNQNYAVFTEDYNVDFAMGDSLSQLSSICIDNLDDTQLFTSLLQQRASLQLSPDSGVGDQSPSPESIWMNNPLVTVLQSGSNTLDRTNLSQL